MRVSVSVSFCVFLRLFVSLGLLPRTLTNPPTTTITSVNRYYCSLDGSGLRMDRASRAELHCRYVVYIYIYIYIYMCVCVHVSLSLSISLSLSHANSTFSSLHYRSVDFAVGSEYRDLIDETPCYVFAIDISPRAVACGATLAALSSVTSVVRGLRDAYETTKTLYDRQASGEEGGGVPINPNDVHCNDSPNPLSDVAQLARIGIFTYHRSIQYYSVRREHGEQIKMHIVDAWDPIAALPPSLWLKSVSEEWEEVELLLQRLPELIATEQGLDKDSGFNTAGGYVCMTRSLSASLSASLSSAHSLTHPSPLLLLLTGTAARPKTCTGLAQALPSSLRSKHWARPR